MHALGECQLSTYTTVRLHRAETSTWLLINHEAEETLPIYFANVMALQLA
jgi:hypothetical protein